ncbi:MAG: substrate-binding domain-containing protein [Pseudomonadota bacterium]
MHHPIKLFSIPLLLLVFSLTAFAVHAENTAAVASEAPDKTIAYLVSDIRIPFWSIMDRGVREAAAELDYKVVTYSAHNQAKRELSNTARAITEKVDGIILSPTNSSASVTVLKLAARAGIPVVISDIGTDGGEYVSFIASNNREGAYGIGQLLAEQLKQRGWQEGSVGIIAIPQKRANGQARTAGFMQALNEAGIKSADIAQQVDFSYQETYDYSRDMIAQHPDLRALWLQGSDRYQAALDAIRDAGREGEILLVCFDAEPEFIQLISNGVLVGAAMQQPFLMGEKALTALHHHLEGRAVEKEQRLPVLTISEENIDERLPTIKRNVLGITEQAQPAQ